jgi:acyl-coenzyme A thioesterase PaaI-like protein
MPDQPITHHDLCFGCGLANVFGLHLEAESTERGTLAGRFFVKQDHQGPPGIAHGGVMSAALDEAMALVIHAAGIHAVTSKLDISLQAPAPVGSFVRVAARIDEEDGRIVKVSAAAFEESEDGTPLAAATGVFAVVS